MLRRQNPRQSDRQDKIVGVRMTLKSLVRRPPRRGPERGADLGTIVRVRSGPARLGHSELGILDLCLLLEIRLPRLRTGTLGHRDIVPKRLYPKIFMSTTFGFSHSLWAEKLCGDWAETEP